jgi:glucose-1-phosphate cytidylyltransferase
MKVVILAGGFGTRLSEETDLKPKPMVEIGRQPILWHIMKRYAEYGFDEFVLPVGYKGDAIKRYFMDYSRLHGSLTVELGSGKVNVHESSPESWTVHIIDTGLDTNTGGRVQRLQPWLEGDTFMLTYGDGVCDVDFTELLRFHRAHNVVATVTAVRPPARFGGLIFDGDIVKEFTEKPQIGEGWINGGFMVFEPQIFDYLDGDDCSLERDALEKLAPVRKLAAYRHDRFWQSMDTLRDVRTLEGLWQKGDAPWKNWD